jgi:hypothetical protein
MAEGASDLSVADRTGCLSGSFAMMSLELCPAAALPELNAQRFSGSGGDLLIEVAEGGGTVRASGQLWPGGVKVPGVRVMVTVPMGQGPQWDEMRRSPGLVAIAAAFVGVRAGTSLSEAAPQRTRTRQRK